MFGPGIFGGMFDFNGDGKLDLFEAAAESQFLHDMMSEDEREEEFDSNFDDYDEDIKDEFDSDFDDCDENFEYDDYDGDDY